MKRMLFEYDLKGHRLEYIHHIYMEMLNHMDDEFVIVVPKDFENKRELYSWPHSPNISFRIIDDSIIKDHLGLLSNAAHYSKALRKYALEEKVDSVFLISLMAFIPALVFFIPSRIRVSGIIYRIYLYEWKITTRLNRVKNVLKYLCIRYAPCLKTVFILNDSSAVSKLNHLYHTDKFKYLTDPFNVIDYHPKSIREELGARKGDMVFLHFGGLDQRKGTLEILKAIQILSSDILAKSVFVFAGKIYDSIFNDFNVLISSEPSNARIKVYNGYCSNEFIFNLCYSCDYILIPYHNSSQSSGLLGYSAFFMKPVIGPSDGLIGKLIRKNHLGIRLENAKYETIARSISCAKYQEIRSNYINKISIPEFSELIFRNW